MNFTSNDTVVKDDENSSENMDWFCWLVEGVFILIFGIIGLLGNSISLVLFSKQKKHKIFHNLLLTLTIFDLIYVVCSILLFSISKFNKEYDSVYRLYMLPYLLPVAHVGLTGSVYCTLSMTVERFLAVCYPFLRFSKSAYTSRTFIVPVVIFTLVYNIPKFFELNVKKVCPEVIFENASLNFTNCTEESMMVDLIPTSMRTNRLYIRIYILWMNLIVLILVPFILLVFLNIKIYRKIKHFDEKLRGSFKVFYKSSNCSHTQSSSNNTNNSCVIKRDSSLVRNSRNDHGDGLRIHRGPTNGANRILDRIEKATPDSMSPTKPSSFRSKKRNPLNIGHRNSQSFDKILSNKRNHLFEDEEFYEESMDYDDSDVEVGQGAGEQQNVKIVGSNEVMSLRRREVIFAKISLYIVFVFLVCHGVRLIPNTFEMVATYMEDYNPDTIEFPLWMHRITNLSHFLLAFACSANFFIYFAKHGHVYIQNKFAKRREQRKNEDQRKISIIHKKKTTTSAKITYSRRDQTTV